MPLFTSIGTALGLGTGLAATAGGGLVAANTLGGLAQTGMGIAGAVQGPGTQQTQVSGPTNYFDSGQKDQPEQKPDTLSSGLPGMSWEGVGGVKL